VAQAFHGNFTVLELAAIFRRLGNDSGWQVADAYGRIGGIAVLPPRAGAAVEFDLYVGIMYFNHGYIPSPATLPLSNPAPSVQ
jgi:hypothetical protein